MPLGSGNIIQSNSGNTGATPTATVTVSVSSSTTGNTVIIGLTADEIATTPSGFALDASIVEGSVYHYVFRKQASSGETSWGVSMGATAISAWWVEEVSGLASSPFVAGISNGTTSNVSSISTGTTPAVTSNDLLCYASFGSYNSSSATVTFSGETNSFTEIHDLEDHFSVNHISIAECRLFPGAGGTFESTATLSSSHQASGILVVYTAETAPVAVLDDVSVGGSFVMTGTVTLRDGSGTHLDLYTTDTTRQGSIVIATGAAPAVTGNMVNPTATTPVSTSSQVFAVGNVVSSDTTGEAMVVRDTWIDSGGPEWSNTTNRANTYSTTGWTVIGSATLN